MLDITYHQIPIKAHSLIRKYYILICYAYNIIQAKTRGIIHSKNAMLQMVFKVIHNTVGPNDLVLILVFGTYPWYVTDLPSSLSQQ